MRREPHVRFCERAVVKFRRATHRVITCTSATEARVALEAASRVLKELGVNINLVPDHGIIFAQPCQQARNSTAC